MSIDKEDETLILTRYAPINDNFKIIGDKNKLVNDYIFNIEQNLLLQIIINIDEKSINHYTKWYKDTGYDDNSIIIAIKKKILKTLFTKSQYDIAKTYITKDFCILSYQIQRVLHNFEKQISEFVKQNHKINFNELEKLIKEKYTINIVSNDLHYFTLEPVINWIILKNS